MEGLERKTPKHLIHPKIDVHSNFEKRGRMSSPRPIPVLRKAGTAPSKGDARQHAEPMRPSRGSSSHPGAERVGIRV